MSNVSGVEINKTFKTGILPGKPYYYINACLDLTGLEVGQSPTNYIYYFNKENNFNYLDTSLYPSGPDSYPNFYIIDENAVIGEVVLYTDPDASYTYNGGDISDLNFSVGGAYIPSVAENESDPLDVWSGYTGNSAGPISGDYLANAQVCHYGQEPAYPGEINNEPSLTRKYLALNVNVGIGLASSSSSTSEEKQVVKLGKVKKVNRVVRSRGKAPKVLTEVSGDVIESGKLHVVLKVYPKFQS